ncbi:MAG: UDP-glucose 6-dehydrogenase [Betaproteobacteria bacterium RIFCSPLOWO2_02_FULL_65_24]|nr:MAG: UDP-glucose 6-dehydrogenase [Betaproteobacteria bacterium RIFCSPLOWO2_02_FULL_65_24]OGA87982.1 MAG: UDP-glucose 6-dehydrogenase [Betaproteobacteria bacterium RIFCSPLOWO2_12_FULL_66_14]
MKISIIGSGYVGLVTGSCFAEVGNDVVCLDLDEAKIALLDRGGVPIYEPGLAEMIARNRAAGRLHFTTDVKRAAEHGELQLIAVGTPPGEDGSADLQHVLGAARSIGRHMRDSKIIVNKSTVPVGTADRVREAVAAELRDRRLDLPFSVISNPEFLKEGAAIEDFMRPDRIIIGSDDERATQVMRTLYAPFQRSHERLIVMDVRSAELTKYAANAMLATRISFMNEMANLAERVGADIEHVRLGIGADPRIGYQFLYPGVGYGGSCFPKDVKALMRTAQEAGMECRVLDAVEQVNAGQKAMLARKITARFGQRLDGRVIAVWGLAFKPNTDDMREAPSCVVIAQLLERGARIVAYDPVAMDEARRLFANEARLSFVEHPLGALDGADALAIVTEWKEFRSPDFDDIRARLKTPAIFDGRNLYEPAEVRRHGLEYYPVGRR